MSAVRCPKAVRTDAEPLPELTMGYIAAKAAHTASVCGFSPEDKADLSQSLCLAAVAAREKFDTTRGAALETYLHAVIDNAAKMYVRSACRYKNSRLVLALDRPLASGLEDDDDICLVDTLAGKGDTRRATDELLDDVRSILASMDAEQRSVCLLLLSGKKRQEIPALLGITPYRFRFVLMPSVEAAFRKAFAP